MEAEVGRGAYSFVACLSHLTIDHASPSGRSTVPTPNGNTSKHLGAHFVFFPYMKSKRFAYRMPLLFRLLWPTYLLGWRLGCVCRLPLNASCRDSKHNTTVFLPGVNERFGEVTWPRGHLLDARALHISFLLHQNNAIIGFLFFCFWRHDLIFYNSKVVNCKYHPGINCLIFLPVRIIIVAFRQCPTRNFDP